MLKDFNSCTISLYDSLELMYQNLPAFKPVYRWQTYLPGIHTLIRMDLKKTPYKNQFCEVSKVPGLIISEDDKMGFKFEFFQLKLKL